MPFIYARHVATLALLVSAPGLAAAQCCPGSGTGAELAASGLGESQPSAIDLSLSPEWRVYGFQRDGITYYQINDQTGAVHAIMGNLDGQFWLLPAGNSQLDVSMPGRAVAIPPEATALEVYRNPEFALLLYRQAERSVWLIEPASR